MYYILGSIFVLILYVLHLAIKYLVIRSSRKWAEKKDKDYDYWSKIFRGYE